jgi:cytochrome o ubiquinol oxidase operon protein cyoD
MSAAPAQHPIDDHADRLDPRNVHGHDEHHGDDAPHGSLKSYLVGFGLSVILTAIPFWLVMNRVIPSAQATTAIILAFALVQILVHMVYFLHLNTRSEGGWNMLALIFTLVLVVITLSGSIWVMYHMDTNMMPMAAHEMRNQP